jgi:hypothetical protein
VNTTKADVETDEPERRPEQERNAPAVARHRIGGQQRLQQGHRRGPDQEAEHAGPHHERDGQTAALVRRELGQIHRAAAVFAARREALQAAQQQQQQRGGDADRGVGRQQADGHGGGGHQQDDESQHALPSDPVAERSEDQSAERAHEERRGDREGVEQRRGLVSRREEVGRDERGEETAMTFGGCRCPHIGPTRAVALWITTGS